MQIRIRTVRLKLETIVLCMLTMILTSCISNEKITTSKDLAFFDVNTNVKEIVWSSSTYDFESNCLCSPDTTIYQFDGKGKLIKFDDYDAFVKGRKIKDLPGFQLGFFRGKHGYIDMQSFSGGMSAYETYKWENDRIVMIDFVCFPTQVKTRKYLSYDKDGRLSSADCLYSSLDDNLTEKTDSFAIEYEYVSFDNKANWTERKGWVKDKLFVVELRKITYE